MTTPIHTLLRLPTYVALALVYLYKGISYFLPQSCRYTPSCSQYAIGAIGRFGVIRGIILVGARIIRCNARFHGGLDQVPQQWAWKEIAAQYRTHRISHEKPPH